MYLRIQKSFLNNCSALNRFSDDVNPLTNFYFKFHRGTYLLEFTDYQMLWIS